MRASFPKTQPNWLALLFFAILFVLPPKASAFELMPYTAMIDVSPLSGCCSHQTSSAGFGLLVRIPKINQALGDVEIGGYSDFKYSEATIAKYLHLIGSDPVIDPASTKEMTITRFKAWTATVSYGIGFFSHTTKTTQYNLPALVVGFEATSRFILGYTISDVWSATGLVLFGLGYSADATDFNMGFGAGVSYRF